jgi:hypothetical protein
MKHVSYLLMFGLVASGIAHAESVSLLSNEVEVSNNATLVRSAETPRKVKLTVSVPIQNRVCTQYAPVPVFGPDASCGYNVIYYPCGGVGHHRGGIRRDGVVMPQGICVTQQMRSCQHLETRCVQTGVETNMENRRVTIVFDNAAVSANQTEMYQFTANQMGVGGGVDYEFRAISTEAPVKIKKWDFIWHRFKVKSAQ